MHLTSLIQASLKTRISVNNSIPIPFQDWNTKSIKRKTKNNVQINTCLKFKNKKKEKENEQAIFNGWSHINFSKVSLLSELFKS